MAKPKAVPVRDLARMDNWWNSKIPPVLGISFAAALVYRVPASQGALYIALILFVGLCAGTYGHLINDAFDVESDRKAGKKNQMARFSPWQRSALCSLAILLGFAPAALFHFPPASLILLAIEYLLPTLYSIPPVRLKERGVLGVFADSLGAHAIPSLYVISALAFAPGVASENRHGFAAILFPAVTSLWAFFLGIKGIVAHEVQDRLGDLEAGVSTFATATSFSGLSGLVNRIYRFELGAFLAVIVLLFPLAPTLFFAAVLYGGVVAVTVWRRWGYYRRFDDDAVAIQWWWFSNPFYESYFPLVLALHLALKQPVLAILPIAFATIFFVNLRTQVQRLSACIQDLRMWLTWPGRIDLVGNGAARLTRPADPGNIIRLEIGNPDAEPWQVRLVRPGLVLRAGQRYRASLEVRSDRIRPITFGVWQDYEPWASLGLYMEMTCSTQWSVADVEFTATQDEQQAYVGVWAGANNAAVEVRRCGVFPVLEISAPVNKPPVVRPTEARYEERKSA